MRSHVIVHNGSTQTDITPYIVAGSYDINIDSKYASWNDGNMVEHRIVTAEKVTGSFDIACSDKRNSILLSEFLNIWNSAVTKLATPISNGGLLLNRSAVLVPIPPEAGVRNTI